MAHDIMVGESTYRFGNAMVNEWLNAQVNEWLNAQWLHSQRSMHR
jgi:uncharacterized iron-regulated protein